MENKLSLFFENVEINIDTYYIEPEGADSILKQDPTRSDINPKEFLEYAYDDFELGDNRGFINALSNVKRAIESQSDIIHFSFGISYENLNFPTKMENIQKMGISPSIILKHINKIRVNLEHFYRIPDRDRVEDAIQIAQLFLDVTTLSLTTFWGSFYIFNENEEEKDDKIHNGIRVEYDKERFKLTHIKNGKINSEIEISAIDGDNYLKLIKLSIVIGKHMHNFDEKVGKRIFQHFLLKLD